MSDAFVPIANIADLPGTNSSIAVTFGQIELLLCNADGQIFCVENRCSHRDFPLAGGRIRRCMVLCPEHGVPFDLRTGMPRGELTKVPLRTFEIRIVDGVIELETSGIS